MLRYIQLINKFKIMNVIAKLSLFLLTLIILTSCFNPNKVEHISSKLVEVKPISLSSVVIVLDQEIQNDSRKVEIKDAEIDVKLNDKKIGKVLLVEPIVIEKGRNSSKMILKITFKTSIFNYKPILNELKRADSKIYIDGYVKIKSGFLGKKFKLDNVSIDAAQILKEVNMNRL